MTYQSLRYDFAIMNGLSYRNVFMWETPDQMADSLAVPNPAVKEPLLSSDDEKPYEFNLTKLFILFLDTLKQYRKTLGLQIQSFNDAGYGMQMGVRMEPREVMGALSKEFVKAIEQQLTPVREAAIATYQANTSDLLQQNGLFNTDPAIRSTQENLLFNRGVRPQMTPEQSKEAFNITKQLEMRFDNRYKDGNNEDRPPVKNFVKEQFRAAGEALALANVKLDDLRDANGRDTSGDVLDQLIDNMLERARVTTSTASIESPLSKLSHSVQQYSAEQQKINKEYSAGMQAVLGSEHNLLSPDPYVQEAQKQLMSGTVTLQNPLSADVKKLSEAVLKSRPEPREGYTRILNAQQELQVDTHLLKGQFTTRMSRHPIDEKLEERKGIAAANAIREGVKAQIPAMSQALALSHTDVMDTQNGGKIVDDCLKQMYEKAEKDYEGAKNGMRNMPAAAEVEKEMKNSSTPQLALSAATQVHDDINRTLGNMGVPPEPIPTPTPTAAASASTAPQMRPPM